LKFTVGLILTSFGVFWIGEGLSYPWPGDDWVLLGMFVVLLGVSRLGVRLARQCSSILHETRDRHPEGIGWALRRGLGYSIIIGLWVALVAVGLPKVPLDPMWRGPVLYLGIVVILCENVARSARKKN